MIQQNTLHHCREEKKSVIVAQSSTLSETEISQNVDNGKYIKYNNLNKED